MISARSRVQFDVREPQARAPLPEFRLPLHTAAMAFEVRIMAHAA
jgi:hypothetical protein